MNQQRLEKGDAGEGLMDLYAPFVARLESTPTDRLTWLVFADWLDERDDPLGRFVRLSIELGDGHVEEDFDSLMKRLQEFAAGLPLQIQKLLAAYRSAQPVRFRVKKSYLIGHDPPQEMFGDARTVEVGMLDAGTLRIGTQLRFLTESGPVVKTVVAIFKFLDNIDSMRAGYEPWEFGVGVRGHVPVIPGSIAVVANGS